MYDIKIKTKIMFLFLISIVVPSGLNACSCIGESSVQEGIKNADAVFIGTILNKSVVTIIDSVYVKKYSDDPEILNSFRSKTTVARYDVLIDRIYKGHISSDTLTLFTGLGGGDCGIRFETGSRYIIYAEKETYFGQINNDFPFPKGENIFWTYSCLRTNLYSQNENTEIEKFIKKSK